MISKFDFASFCSKCNTRYLNASNQRYGQFFVNQFRADFPDAIIPEEVDCFYDDEKLQNFLQFVEQFLLDRFHSYCEEMRLYS